MKCRLITLNRYKYCKKEEYQMKDYYDECKKEEYDDQKYYYDCKKQEDEYKKEWVCINAF